MHMCTQYTLCILPNTRACFEMFGMFWKHTQLILIHDILGGGEVERRFWPMKLKTPPATQLHWGRLPGVPSLPWFASSFTRSVVLRFWLSAYSSLGIWVSSKVQDTCQHVHHSTLGLLSTKQYTLFSLSTGFLTLTRSKVKRLPQSLGLAAEEKLSISVDQIRARS